METGPRLFVRSSGADWSLCRPDLGLKTLPDDKPYREALLGADLVITDSGLMVMLWNILERDSVRRLSGLEYLRDLLRSEDVRALHGTFWVMSNPESAAKNLAWLKEQGIEVAPEDVYLAPRYGRPVEDPALVAILNQRRPKHVVVTVGGGVQEILGYYLKRHLDYLPAIHCIGAAIAFLSGDQVFIPVWADRSGLGGFCAACGSRSSTSPAIGRRANSSP